MFPCLRAPPAGQIPIISEVLPVLEASSEHAISSYDNAFAKYGLLSFKKSISINVDKWDKMQIYIFPQNN